MARPEQHWCDLGSGGGVPGLIMAVEAPDLELTLLDRSSSRCQFLRRMVHQLGLGERVRVAEGDASELAHHAGHRERYDGVVSRAFGAPPLVAEVAAALVTPGGRIVVSEPPASDEGTTSRWPTEPLAKLGLELVDLMDGPPAFAVLARRGELGDATPRPWKKMARSPWY